MEEEGEIHEAGEELEPEEKEKAEVEEKGKEE